MAVFSIMNALNVICSVIDAKNVNHFFWSAKWIRLARNVDQVPPLKFPSKKIFHAINVSLQ